MGTARRANFGRTPTPFQDPLGATLWMVLGLTTVRLVALFTTPFELYPDEAQYWLWSRELAFGYYSKPPMVAWLIALTTGLFGNAEPIVRLASPLLHGGTALILYAVASRLYDARTGFWAAAIYSLMPGVQLSAGLASTDAALLFFLSLTLLAYVSLQTGASRLRAAAGFGAALGLAFLSKYAALYIGVGAILHAVLSRDARRPWSLSAIGAAVSALAVVAGPNVWWNATNGFSTVTHTAANADWDPARLVNPQEFGEFLIGQFGVFGPVPFFALGLVALAAVRRRLRGPELLLFCFAAPPLLLVGVQAFLSRANANWAGATYVAGSILAAAWLLESRSRERWLKTGLALQAAAALAFVVLAGVPGAADAVGASNSFKRARGWAETTDRVLDRAETEARSPAGLTAVAVDDRFLFNAIAYYGRDRLGRSGLPPLTAWVRMATPQTQAETTDPLTPALGRRVLVASIVPGYRAEAVADFARAGPWSDASVRLDPRRERDLALVVAEGYRPLLRDPVTGLPPRAP
jgi:4-amino-4-deoxy-L-arabinose transferase-like glycosyltransferase